MGREASGRCLTTSSQNETYEHPRTPPRTKSIEWMVVTNFRQIDDDSVGSVAKRLNSSYRRDLNPNYVR